MSTIDDDDLNEVLRRAYPQGHALLRHEGGTGILRLGAREVINNPLVARDTLDPRGLRALGRALLAVGEEHVALAKREFRYQYAHTRVRARESHQETLRNPHMARPRSSKEKHRPRHLGFRTAVWVHDAVHRLAAEQDQPVSDIAHELLEIALGQLGITQGGSDAR